jgi:hypothetical protein
MRALQHVGIAAWIGIAGCAQRIGIASPAA